MIAGDKQELEKQTERFEHKYITNNRGETDIMLGCCKMERHGRETNHTE